MGQRLPMRLVLTQHKQKPQRENLLCGVYNVRICVQLLFVQGSCCLVGMYMYGTLTVGSAASAGLQPSCSSFIHS